MSVLLRCRKAWNLTLAVTRNLRMRLLNAEIDYMAEIIAKRNHLNFHQKVLQRVQYC